MQNEHYFEQTILLFQKNKFLQKTWKNSATITTTTIAIETAHNNQKFLQRIYIGLQMKCKKLKQGKSLETHNERSTNKKNEKMGNTANYLFINSTSGQSIQCSAWCSTQ